MDDSKKGLYDKYLVRRRDGSSEKNGKHEGCNYFVLDLTHDKFAVPAILAYANACTGEFPDLAFDLIVSLPIKSTSCLECYGTCELAEDWHFPNLDLRDEPHKKRDQCHKWINIGACSHTKDNK